MELVALTDKQLVYANAILAHALGKAVVYADTTVAQTFSDGSTAAIESVIKAQDKLGMSPWGIYVGGTGLLKEEAGVPVGEDGQIAIQALKDNGRLIQLGRGRGKLVVLFNVKELTVGSTYRNRASTRRASKADVVSLGEKVSELESEIIRLSAILNIKS